MTRPIMTIRAGETLSMGLVALVGDVNTIATFKAALKLVGPNGVLPTESSPEAALFSYSTTSDVGNGSAGLLLTLSSNQTAALVPGLYATDARFTVAGGVIITTPVFVEVRAPVTGA